MNDLVTRTNDLAKNVPEWELEPSLEKFVYTATYSYPCMIQRNPSLLHLCGYVGVMKNHDLYGADCNDERLDTIDVHGGLTFAGHFPEHHPDQIWFFGFDCAHSFDFTPGLIDHKFYPNRYDQEYRNIKYVREQVEHLAAQIAALKGN